MCAPMYTNRRHTGLPIHRRITASPDFAALYRGPHNTRLHPPRPKSTRYELCFENIVMHTKPMPLSVSKERPMGFRVEASSYHI